MKRHLDNEVLSFFRVPAALVGNFPGSVAVNIYIVCPLGWEVLAIRKLVPASWRFAPMNETATIDVLLATFRRPDLLAQALQSLARLELGGLTIRVVVVDNDKEASARTTVQAFRKTVPFEVIYDIEPAQGVVRARNRALNQVRADYFAFFDDDETVPADWLTALFATLQRYGADAVQGPLRGVLPPDAPAWAKDQPSFRPTRLATGTRLEFCATNNILVRTSALGCPAQRFDLKYNLSGGEDADFFYRLHRAGKLLVWCNEALVSEHVPEHRVNLPWLRRRGFRSGQSFMRIVLQRDPLGKKLLWSLKKVGQLVAGLLAAPMSLLISYSCYVGLTVKIMTALGCLSIVFSSAVYEEYHADRYQ
jgi:succinoglycan biosynthesis protein ExoM